MSPEDVMKTRKSDYLRAAEAVDAARALHDHYGSAERMPTEVKTMYGQLLGLAKGLREKWEKWDSEPQYDVNPAGGELATVHSIGGDGYTGGSDVKAWADATATKIVRARRGEGKSLATGSIDAALPIPGRRLADLPTRVFELFAFRPVDTGRFDTDTDDRLGEPVNSVEYLRQVTRTHNAEFVPDTETKPTSVYRLSPVVDRLRVIAHLSEPIPNRFLDDAASLRRFLVDEMRNGLLFRLNDAIVNGDSSNENNDEFDGLLEHAGQPFPAGDDIVTTTADLLMAQLDVGETPTHWIFKGTVWNGLSLTREQQDGSYLFGTPVDGPGRRLHGLPVVLEPSLDSSLGMLVDRDLAELRGKPTIQVDWDSSGELFETNETRARVEWRTVLVNYRPSAFKAFDTGEDPDGS